MKDNFLIIKNMKLFINSLDDMVSVIQNRDRLLKEKNIKLVMIFYII